MNKVNCYDIPYRMMEEHVGMHNPVGKPENKVSKTNTIMIDIFRENLDDYIPKLYRAADGQYELDHYDRQVLALAREQILQSYSR